MCRGKRLGASSRASAEQAESSAAGGRQLLNLAEGGTKTVRRTLEEMSVWDALIAGIHSALNSTVMVTEDNRKTAESGIKLCQETGETLSGVAEAINEIVLSQNSCPQAFSPAAISYGVRPECASAGGKQFARHPHHY